MHQGDSPRIDSSGTWKFLYLGEKIMLIIAANGESVTEIQRHIGLVKVNSQKLNKILMGQKRILEIRNEGLLQQLLSCMAVCVGKFCYLGKKKQQKPGSDKYWDYHEQGSGQIVCKK